MTGRIPSVLEVLVEIGNVTFVAGIDDEIMFIKFSFVSFI